jgi:hypothetical protein
MTVANTLAYYDTARITSVKSFIVQAPGRLEAATFFSAIFQLTMFLKD